MAACISISYGRGIAALPPSAEVIEEIGTLQKLVDPEARLGAVEFGPG